jgi:hypothetical protein
MKNIVLKVIEFLKNKLIKFFLSLFVLLFLAWLLSGTMVEDWVPSVTTLIPSGIALSLEYFSFWMKNLAALCLLVVLARVMLGLPVWKWIYIPIGIGVALSIFT